jgi:hypothetical protein
MSDSEGLYKIYGRYATKINPELFSEAIENAIPEEPLLLSNSDIEFLRQFDEEYWTQALYKRNEKLFRYLVNLDNLRKKFRNAVYESELEEVKKKFDDPTFARMNPFVKKRQIKTQAEAAAKAVATKLLPAGEKINTNILKDPLLRKLKAPVKAALAKNIKNINNYYLGKDMKFEDLRTGRSAPETVKADPKLADLAKHIEGSYGSKSGHDLHNPRILQRKKLDHQAMKDELQRLQSIAKAKKKPLPTMDDVVELHKELEPKFVTDGFVFPSYTEIQSAVRDKIKAVRSGLSTPQDPDDEKRLDTLRQTLGTGYRPTADAGVHPTEKQLVSHMEAQIRSELNAENIKRRAAGQKEIDKPANKIRDEAKQRIRQQLKNYMPENFKDHLKKMGFSEKDVADVKNPYRDTNIEMSAEGFGGDSRLIKQNPKYDNEQYFPMMSGKVRKIKNGIEEIQNKNLPAIFKSGFYKDVTLQYPHDNHSVEIDTTVSDLIPGNELGEKFFDKELFERLLRRINFLKQNPTAPEVPAVTAILKRFGLNEKSSPNDVIDASHRHFYQKARREDYKQGSNVSSTWSHHPTRLSAKLDFFNRYHDKAKYDQVVSALLEKGVKRTKNAPPIPLFDFIVQDVNNKLDVKQNDSDELPKLVMQRVKDTIIGLVQLRIFESLGNAEILKWYGVGKPAFKCFDNPSSPGCFGNGAYIGDIVNKEIKRIKDQDLFTGSIRKRAQLAGSEEDAASLTCKQGERGWQTGRCVYGADLRTINDYFKLGSKKLDKLAKIGEESSTEGDEESITEERKKIRLVLEGLNEMNEAIIVLLTALQRASDPKISEQDAKINAKHQLTDFLKAHIRQDYPEFIRSLHGFYTQSFKALQAAKPKEAESLKIPTMIRHRRENRPTTKKFFSDRFLAAAKGQDLTATDEYENAIATANLNKLNKIYDTTVRHSPSLADKVYNSIVSKLEDPKSKEDFALRNEENNNILKNSLARINDISWARAGMVAPYMFFGKYADVEKNPPQQWAEFYRTYVPYLSDKNLLWLSRYLAENINYIPFVSDSDATPEQKEEGRQIEAKISRYLPLRHFVINYLHEQIKKRNLMTSLIARINDPETLEQFEKSSKAAEAAFANHDKILKKINATKQQ